MDTSVVIPTWNEAAWLPRLLRVLDGRTGIRDVVVADNHSSDDTRAIADRFGCRVIDGGRPGRARNLGAMAAEGRYLLFIDADVVPTGAALSSALESAAAGIRGAVCYRHIPIDDHLFVRSCYRAADLWFWAARRVGLHHALASFLLVDRESFLRVGGFDEHLDPGEDVDLVRRLARVGTSQYRRDAPVLISSRRFSVEHGVRFAAKTVFWELLRTIGWRINPIPYRWERHDPASAAAEDAWLTVSRTDPEQ